MFNMDINCVTPKRIQGRDIILQRKVFDEKRKYEALLNHVMPKRVIEDLKCNRKVDPKLYKNVSVLFADFKGFTEICESLKPESLIKKLQMYFEGMEEIALRNGLEKIKTMGDSMLCIGGITQGTIKDTVDTVTAGLEMVDFVSSINKLEKKGNPCWKLRVGIHTGDVIAGVIGKNKIEYDVWGDTINVAARVEQCSQPNMVNISDATWNQIKPYYLCQPRGKIMAKNKGKMKMYFVGRLKPEYTLNEDSRMYNEQMESELLLTEIIGE